MPLRACRPLPPRHLDAFRGLHVRTQADAERVHALLHARDVAHHAGLVDQRGGRGNVGRKHSVASIEIFAARPQRRDVALEPERDQLATPCRRQR